MKKKKEKARTALRRRCLVRWRPYAVARGCYCLAKFRIIAPLFRNIGGLHRQALRSSLFISKVRRPDDVPKSGSWMTQIRQLKHVPVSPFLRNPQFCLRAKRTYLAHPQQSHVLHVPLSGGNILPSLKLTKHLLNTWQSYLLFTWRFQHAMSPTTGP
jgi:hypothetical protein